jgi:hypothetical protein
MGRNELESGMVCRVAWAVVLSGLGCAAMVSDGNAQTRGVIELFTSQGCSSCPPADQLAGRFANDPSIVAMSLPIDYWDYLGWRDTLATPGNTARQRGYARARGDREVYTPQAVVNGRVHVPGADEQAITEALAETRIDPSILAVPVYLRPNGDRLSVAVSAGSSPNGAQVWLCGLISSMPVTIDRGENRGQTLTYYNVVRRRQKIGDWHGEALDLSVPMRDLLDANIDRVAVMVQTGTLDNPGTVLGAAIEPLRSVQAHTAPPQSTPR